MIVLRADNSSPPSIPGLAGVSSTVPGSDLVKIVLAYDLWSPYVYIDPQGEPTGFGIEFVKLMQAEKKGACSKLNITLVQDQWERMWHDKLKDVKLGDGVTQGLYHAGITYTHLRGVRPRMGDFSYAITRPDAQPAALLVK